MTARGYALPPAVEHGRPPAPGIQPTGGVRQFSAKSAAPVDNCPSVDRPLQVIFRAPVVSEPAGRLEIGGPRPACTRPLGRMRETWLMLPAAEPRLAFLLPLAGAQPLSARQSPDWRRFP
jgi:hypothetical protein